MMRPESFQSDLSQLQRWFQAALTHPPVSAISEVPIDAILTRSQALSAAERLAVYQRAYLARLLECLTAEFPATAHVLGEESFQIIGCEYLQANPSQSHTLARLGDGFPEFLRVTRPPRESETPDFADLVIELATLELVYTAVFDSLGPETALAATSSLSFTIETDLNQWETSRCEPFPCVRQLHFQFPVHEVCTAVRKGEAADVPAPRETHLVVTRRDYVVRRLEMSHWQAKLLSKLLSGQPVAGAVAETVTAASTAGETITPADVQSWFRAWWLLPVFRGVNSTTAVNL